MPIPQNSALYSLVKREADAKFLAPTSAYKSAWIVVQYKKRGGLYVNDGEAKGLTRWFKEKWVDLERPLKKDGKVIGYESCGRNVATIKGTYPLCRPSRRVNASTPKTVKEVNPKVVKKVEKEKQTLKHKGRIKF